MRAGGISFLLIAAIAAAYPAVAAKPRSDLDLYAAAYNWSGAPLVCFRVDSEGRYWEKLQTDLEARMIDARRELVARFGFDAVKEVEGGHENLDMIYINGCSVAATYRDITRRARNVRALERRLKPPAGARQ